MEWTLSRILIILISLPLTVSNAKKYLVSGIQRSGELDAFRKINFVLGAFF